jgi:hypothetical protein
VEVEEEAEGDEGGAGAEGEEGEEDFEPDVKVSTSTHVPTSSKTDAQVLVLVL